MDSDDDGPPYGWFKSRERDPPPTSLPGLSISPECPPSLLPPLADDPIVVERDPPPTSSSSLPLGAMAIDGSDHPESDGLNIPSLLPPLADDPIIVERDPPPTSSSSLPLGAMVIDGSDHPESDGLDVQPVPDPELDLFNASKQDVISVEVFPVTHQI